MAENPGVQLLVHQPKQKITVIAAKSVVAEYSVKGLNSQEM